MHRVVLHGAFRDHIPAKYKKGFYLDFNDIRELLSGAEQYLPIKELLTHHGAEFRIGASVRTARKLTLEELTRGRFKGLSGEEQIKLHIIPSSDGDAITMAMITNALIQAAIAITVNLAVNALFPPDQPDNGTNKNKSVIYGGGLNQQKEGIPLPYVAGDDVLCPMNIIEGGVTTLSTGQASLSFQPGAGANGNHGVIHNGGGGIVGRDPGTGGGSSYMDLDSVAGSKNHYAELRDALAQQALEGDGGSKGGKTMANTMWSSNRISILGAVGIGPMGGLAGDTPQERLQKVYVNEVPLMSGNGVPAFQGIEIDTRKGEPGQTEIGIVPNVEATFNDPVDLRKQDNQGNQLSYSRATTPGVKTDLIKARVNFTLLFTSEKGNQRPESVTVGVSTWRQGQPEIHYGNWTASGKSSEPCQFDLPIPAPPLAPGGSDTDRWFFKIYRVTPDSTDDKYVRETSVQGWTEVQFQQLTYDGSTGCPPTALLAASIDNAQFGDAAIPELASRWRGYEVELPAIYNPLTRTYSGPWNGVDTIRHYTSNPAYHWSTLATLEKGGAGIPKDYIDKYNIKAVAEFCDEIVKGRPRFTLNKSFTDSAVTIDLLRDLAQTFRCYLYFDGRQFKLVPDKPGQVISHFINNSGVKDGFFAIDSVPIQDRINECQVEWDNPADFFQTAIVTYRDEAAIALLADSAPEQGVVRKRAYKIGCTNEAEAYDWARYLVYCAQHEWEVLTFDTLMGATGYEPGQLIAVSDYKLSGEQPNGRIEEVIDTNTLRLEGPVTLNAGVSYTLFAQGPNGIVLKPMALLGATTTSQVVTVPNHGLVAGTMAKPVNPLSVQPVVYRITSIQETSPGAYTVTAQLHDANKYSFVDGVAPSPTPAWTILNQEPVEPPAVINVTRSGGYDIISQTSSINLEISWPAVERATKYLLECRAPGGQMETLMQDGRLSYTMENCREGTYVFTVKSINIADASGQPRVKTYHVQYDEEPAPEDLAPAPVIEGII